MLVRCNPVHVLCSTELFVVTSFSRRQDAPEEHINLTPMLGNIWELAVLLVAFFSFPVGHSQGMDGFQNTSIPCSSFFQPMEWQYADQYSWNPENDPSLLGVVTILVKYSGIHDVCQPAGMKPKSRDLQISGYWMVRRSAWFPKMGPRP